LVTVSVIIVSRAGLSCWADPIIQNEDARISSEMWVTFLPLTPFNS